MIWLSDFTGNKGKEAFVEYYEVQMLIVAEQLQNDVKYILEFDYETFKKWEEANLKDSEPLSPYIKAIQQVAGSIDTVPFDTAPFDRYIDEIANSFKEFIKILGQAQGVKDARTFNEKEYDHVKSKAHSAIFEFINSSQKVLAFAIISNNSHSKTMSDLRQLSYQYNIEIEGQKKKAEAALMEIKELLEKAKIQVLSKRVSEHALFFQDGGKGFRRTANKWLWGTIGSAIATFLVAVCWQFVFPFKDSESIFTYLPHFSTKVIILALLISALVWCSKLYKSNLNLAIIYKHKADSLATFEEFAKATTNDVTKDYVLQETTRAIFSVPVTGLINQEPLPIESGTKIFEMVKGNNQ